MAAVPGRVQFVISGPFLLLLLLAAAFMTTGFWLYTHPQPPPPGPPSPPYYVNRTLTAVRPCYQCAAIDGKLKPQGAWKLGRATDIPAGEQWWFVPVEDPPIVAKIEGIPVLAVHPAREKDKPWDGFDQGKVLLVVFQDLEPKFAIEHPAPTPVSPTPEPGPTTSGSSLPDSSTAETPAPTSTAPQQ
jgi:hypothetical protein